MILFDKTKAEARLILTLAETSNETLFNLVLHSFYTNKSYTIELGEDVSPFSFRYNEYFVPASVFTNMEAGRYVFAIQERNTGRVVERGTLTIMGEPETEYISITPDETEDDFITLD
jgi:hypothetical protein